MITKNNTNVGVRPYLTEIRLHKLWQSHKLEYFFYGSFIIHMHTVLLRHFSSSDTARPPVMTIYNINMQ